MIRPIIELQTLFFAGSCTFTSIKWRLDGHFEGHGSPFLDSDGVRPVPVRLWMKVQAKILKGM